MVNNSIQPKRGRPKLLEMSPELVDDLCDHLRRGMFLREACSLVGVTHHSVYLWMRNGSRDEREGNVTLESQFSAAIKRAMAEAEERAVENIMTAGANPAFWAANAWYLERRYPEKYGRRDRVALEHSGQMGIGVANVDKPLSERLNDEEKRNAAKDIARSLAIIGSGNDGPIRGAGSVSESGNEWPFEDSETLTVPEWETD